jgi:hypothetical protein
MDGITIVDVYPFYVFGPYIVISIVISIFIVVGAALLRYFGTRTPDDYSSEEESSEESSEESWEPGPSSLEIIELRERVARTFPDMADAFDASGGLPDVNGACKSDVDLVKFDKNHQGYETTFGESLRRIKAANAKHPNRTVYTIIFDDCTDRAVNIYITSDNNDMKSVMRRTNELMLNNYSEVASIAIWFMRYKKMTCAEAYAEVLCLNIENRDDFDPYEAMCREDLEPIAMTMNQELKEIYNRI